MKRRCFSALLCLLCSTLLRADGPGDNLPDHVRPVPPPGLEVPDAVGQDLRSGLDELAKAIDALRQELPQKQPRLVACLPDVEVFHKAVRYALVYHEFYHTNQFKIARELLQEGLKRADALRSGTAPWLTATGLVVRAYQSRVDGSIQPYGLVVPSSYRPDSPHAFRLDTWFHGRGETLTELDFIHQRQTSPGQFTPANAFVLHLYGRYCNGSRFAGETDFFEAFDRVNQDYPIDPNRLIVRGFSLGGASCWDMAVHHAGMWAAAAPGAGFSETADFLKVFQKETLTPTWYEQKLWHLYDATDYAVNLFQCPTVAYSGELDTQKQAADKMAEALAAEGISLVHVIGPKARHFYEPKARAEINRRIDSLAATGRNPVPSTIHFTTWTLRYNRMLWLTVDALEHHWERARVDAVLDPAINGVRATTTNVVALTFSMEPGLCPLDNARPAEVVLDGQRLAAPRALSDRSWTAHFRKTEGSWAAAASPEVEEGPHKRHGLQGPIDDAFMESFLIVRPTGKPLNAEVGAWTRSELSRATNQWQLEFRGEPRVKDDVDVTEDDIARHNLVLWGDPSSNKLLPKIMPRLPIRWDSVGVHTGDAIFPANRYVPVLIYPNPLNPKRYLVLNSGFTFREYDYLNNARQTPKLPDYAIIDLTVPPNTRTPGGISRAGFFGEDWQWLPEDQQRK